MATLGGIADRGNVYLAVSLERGGRSEGTAICSVKQQALSDHPDASRVSPGYYDVPAAACRYLLGDPKAELMTAAALMKKCPSLTVNKAIFLTAAATADVVKRMGGTRE